MTAFIDRGELTHGGTLHISSKSQVGLSVQMDITGQYCIDDSSKCFPSTLLIRSKGSFNSLGRSTVNLGRSAFIRIEGGSIHTSSSSNFNYYFDQTDLSTSRIIIQPGKIFHYPVCPQVLWGGKLAIKHSEGNWIPPETTLAFARVTEISQCPSSFQVHIPIKNTHTLHWRVSSHYPFSSYFLGSTKIYTATRVDSPTLYSDAASPLYRKKRTNI